MFKQILIPLDRSPLAEQALGRAAAIARAGKARLEVVIVRDAAARFGDADHAPENADWRDEAEYVSAIGRELASGSGVPVSTAVLNGEPVEAIAQRAWEIEADVVVMTSHGRTGLSRAWLGSTADGLIRQSSVPVLMSRPIQTDTDRRAARRLFERILVPVDGTRASEEIVPAAVSLAKCSSARVLLLHVVTPVPFLTTDVGLPYAYAPVLPDALATAEIVRESEARLSELASRTERESGLEVDAHVIVEPHPAAAILAFAHAHAVDAVAMTTHGRAASRMIIGSVADKVLRSTALPLLLFRPLSQAVRAEPAPSTTARLTLSPV